MGWRPGWCVVLVGGMVALLGACGGSSGSAATGLAPSSISSSASPNPPAASEVNPAGDIPDNQVFVAYTPPGGLFVVRVPQGWARSSEGSAVVFTDKFNSVRIDSVARSQAPTVTSARSQELARLQGSVPGFRAAHVTMVQPAAGPAVLITYQASSAASTVTGRSVTQAVERYEFWRAGHEVMLTLSAPQGSDNVDPWRTITNSLRWQ